MFIKVKKGDIVTLWRTHDYDPVCFKVDKTKEYTIPEETFKMDVNGVEVYSSKKVIRTSPFYLKRQ